MGWLRRAEPRPETLGACARRVAEAERAWHAPLPARGQSKWAHIVNLAASSTPRYARSGGFSLLHRVRWRRIIPPSHWLLIRPACETADRRLRRGWPLDLSSVHHLDALDKVQQGAGVPADLPGIASRRGPFERRADLADGVEAVPPAIASHPVA